MIFLIPLILVVIILLSYFSTNSSSSLLWMYLIMALGSSGLLLFLVLIGMIDLGGGDSLVNHDASVGHDVSVADGGVVDANVADVSAGKAFIISPSSFLINTALFGAFGIITFYLFSFLPSKVRDFSSIFISAILSGLTYIYVLKFLFNFLKTYSMVKSTSYFEGKEAEVLYDIPEDGFGKINVRSDDKFDQFLAKSEDGIPIPAGSIVRIKKHMGTFVIVEKIN